MAGPDAASETGGIPPARVPHILRSPITIADQGSFFAGGRLARDQDGRTTHVAHLYASFQKPVRPRLYPLVMWHGGGQTGKTWESTPDGREGYDTIWLRRDYSVFIVDEPFIGRGGRPAADVVVKFAYEDQRSFEAHRRGLWNMPARPDRTPYDGTQASFEPWSFAQLQQQGQPHLLELGAPRPGSPQGIHFEALPYPEAPDAGVALLEATGPSILVTHSHGGFLGWSVALLTDQIRGIISYEPVRFIFPQGEMPPDLGSWAADAPGQRDAQEVPLERFLKLTRFPIQIVYGDYLDQPGTGSTIWRDAASAAERFREAVNRHGGDVEILHLPSAGVTGNSHFPFSDRNNLQVAEHMSAWLQRKRLDAYADGPLLPT